jgi:DNA (cytosine-5)-methyltransferase 1
MPERGACHLTPQQPQWRFLSLFAGVGGFDLPLTRLGMECVGQVELDAGCRSVLARHFPEVPRHDDIRTTTSWWQAQGRPAVDLVCAGFPCQDLSVAGRRAGLAGPRSGLFFDLAGVIGAVRPGWVLLENVPGLLSSNQGRDFAAVLGTLVELGYGVSWRVLDSRYFGVPQRRRRVFLVGRRGGICPFQILFEPPGGRGDPAPRRPPPPAGAFPAAGGAGAARRHRPAGPRSDRVGADLEVTASLGHHGHSSPRGDGSDTLIISHAPGGLVAPALLANRGGQRTTDLNTPLVAVPSPAGDRGRPAPRMLAWGFAENQRGEITTNDVATGVAGGGGKPGQGYPAVLVGSPDPSGTLTARSYKGPSSTADDAALIISHSHPPGPAAPAAAGVPADQAADGPAVGVVVRRLTPRECERLQGFPEDWTAVGADGRPLSDSARYRAMGNAVTVPVVAWIAARILTHHPAEPQLIEGDGR